MRALGRTIQAYREARGMSGRQLAAAAGLAPQTLWLIEQGATASPRPRTLAAIARALGLPEARLRALAAGVLAGDGAATPQSSCASGDEGRVMRGGPPRGRAARADDEGDTMKWVTRTGVRMDRAAMIWLIRRTIDPDAEIVLLPEGEVMEYAAEAGATPFHHPKAELRNTGLRTGFDALRTHYDLQDPALGLLALIIRGAETNDRSLTQWSPGFWAIGSGLRQLATSDAEFIAQLGTILDGLYRFCQDQLAPAARPAADRRET